jgi:uncharacterized damage-inducible protein DinB
MDRPTQKEYASYYKGYVDIVPKGNIIKIMEKQNEQFCEFLAQVTDKKADYRYAEGKWSVKEVIGHIVDTELVFLYRALRFSRKDTQELPGFEQNDYVANSNYSQQTLGDLVEQFYLLRKTSVAFYKSLAKNTWTNKGKANGQSVTVKALSYIMVGHVIHHMQIINKRYLA